MLAKFEVWGKSGEKWEGMKERREDLGVGEALSVVEGVLEMSSFRRC